MLNKQFFIYSYFLFLTVRAPLIVLQPRMVSVGVGGSATFTVVASGEGLTYQWLGPGGVALSDMPGEIAGATTSTLQIFNIQSNDAGSYQVRVSNTGGSVTSDPASLIIGRNACLIYYLLKLHTHHGALVLLQFSLKPCKCNVYLIDLSLLDS